MWIPSCNAFSWRRDMQIGSCSCWFFINVGIEVARLTTAGNSPTHIESIVLPDTWICSRWSFTLYHCKSPWNHHLGEYFLLFPGIEHANPRIPDQVLPSDPTFQGVLKWWVCCDLRSGDQRVTWKNLAYVLMFVWILGLTYFYIHNMNG